MTAEAWLREVLDAARRGAARSQGWSGRESRLVDSASNEHLLPALGEQPIKAITTDEIERCRRSLTGLSN